MRWMKGMGIIVMIAFFLVGCDAKDNTKQQERDQIAGSSQEQEKNAYKKIKAEEVKERMEEKKTICLVDVRSKEEYDAGHIEGAILLPVDTIGEEKPVELPDMEAEIILYCRSGNRSRTAAIKLLDIGYTNVLDMGGIIDWPYGVEK